MKKLNLLLLTLVVTLSAIAAPVSKESAQQKAAKFISGKTAFARGQHKIEMVSSPGEYYVFNIGTNGGFVIVSGDDTTPEILGYSKDGSFNSQDMPDNMRSFLRSLREQIKAIQARGLKVAPQKTVSGGAIAPLLGGIAYNQGTPFNLLCPDIPILVNGELSKRKAVTGCVATAMAQVIRYWQYPNKTSAITGYNLNFKSGENTYTVEVPSWEPTTLDWANMLPSYNGNESDAQKNAVATLLALCGTSVNMKYSTGASSASSSSVPNALKNYFGYDQATKEILRLNYRAAEWNQIIYDELKNERPVLYSGQSSGGGHSFIVDGYDSDDYFHVNWGWGGYQDNYFLLSVLDPGANAGIGASSSSDGYGYGQSAVIGIQPPTGIEVKETIALTTSLFSAYQVTSNETTQKQFDIIRDDTSKDFDINILCDIRNRLSKEYSFDVGLGAFDKDWNLKKAQYLFYWENLKPGYGNLLELTLSFGAGLTDGTYIIAPISREKGTEEWLPDFGANNYNVTATISGNKLTIMNPHIDLSGTIAPSGKTEVNSALPLVFTITNNGTLFNNEVFLLVDGKRQGGRVLEIEAGGRVKGEISFIPSAIGSYNVNLSYVIGTDEQSKQPIYQSIASTIVTVNEAPKASLDIKATVLNAKNNTISTNDLTIKLTVTNNGSTTYDNVVGIKLYKNRDDGSGYGDGVGSRQEEIVLKPGETKSYELTFTNLINNANYFFYTHYYSQGIEQSQWGSNVTVKIEGSNPVDNNYNAQDIVKVINYMMNNNIKGFDTKKYDLNNDKVVNTADIVLLVRLILGNGN